MRGSDQGGPNEIRRVPCDGAPRHRRKMGKRMGWKCCHRAPKRLSEQPSCAIRHNGFSILSRDERAYRSSRKLQLSTSTNEWKLNRPNAWRLSREHGPGVEKHMLVDGLRFKEEKREKTLLFRRSYPAAPRALLSRRTQDERVVSAELRQAHGQSRRSRSSSSSSSNAVPKRPSCVGRLLQRLRLRVRVSRLQRRSSKSQANTAKG